MKVADEVWVATAMLHRERSDVPDFAVDEVRERAQKESWGKDLRPGFYQHLSYHCVANKRPNPSSYRMLFETFRGRRRLYKPEDLCHPGRQNGKMRPNKGDLPPEYRQLTDWYDDVYSKLPGNGNRAAAKLQQESLESSPPSLTEGMCGDMFGVSLLGRDGQIVIPESLRQELGIREGTRVTISRVGDQLLLQPITEKFLSSLRGIAKGPDSLLEAWEREHRMER
ncbi:MAG TPA: AbrB/MazE/SpoVT family DNA-binding domain-containing protein [Terriglobales bacterium]|nr:AbrB/MazE/SpoVT family DNA-binding domain-containing protein [Terriglobales bacterium]